MSHHAGMRCVVWERGLWMKTGAPRRRVETCFCVADRDFATRSFTLNRINTVCVLSADPLPTRTKRVPLVTLYATKVIIPMVLEIVGYAA